MIYKKNEAISEIMRRKSALIRKRERRKACVMSVCSAALLSMIVSAISVYSDLGASVESASVYGSFLLSAEAGSYVVVAVAAFALGTAAAVLTIKLREKDRKNK